MTLKCPAERVDGVVYPETAPDETVTLECGEGFIGVITRQCGSSGAWQPPVKTCRGRGGGA